MYAAFSPLIKFILGSKVNIYSSVFKIQGQFTVMLLLVGCILVTMNQYFGDPVNCLVSDPAKTKKDVINSYCWIMGTFTYRISHENKTYRNSADIARVTGLNTPQEILVQKYYQWVPFVLIIQAIIFRLPLFMWKSFENGLMSQLCSHLGTALKPEEWTGQRKDQVISYLKNSSPRSRKLYAIRFLICEFLNVVAVIGNMFLINSIFNDFWLRFTPAVTSLLQFDADRWRTYSGDVFPKLAKCTFNDYGPSGSVQSNDAFCLLPMNIVNEKIFAGQWIWLIVLLIFSVSSVLIRLVTLVLPSFRLLLLQSRAFSVHQNDLKRVTRNGEFGEWFLFYMMSQNMNSIVFKELVEDYAPEREKNIACRYDSFLWREKTTSTPQTIQLE